MARLTGRRIVAASSGSVTLALAATDWMLGPKGFVHSGALALLADGALVAAVVSGLPVMFAYPKIAAGLDEPTRNWSPFIRSVFQAGEFVGAMIASRSNFASVSSIACWAMDVASLRAFWYAGSDNPSVSCANWKISCPKNGISCAACALSKSMRSRSVFG